MSERPHADIVSEALRLSTEAEAQGLTVRLLGGLAVRLRSRALPAALIREYKDIDFATPSGGAKAITRFMTAMGYEEDFDFNVEQGHARLLYRDLGNDRQIDFFVGSFTLCHSIPIAERLALEPVTLPLAELVLTKLQVVKMTEKDQRDIVALFHEHEVGEADGDTINASVAARLCANDWGLWRTSTVSLERAGDAARLYGLEPEHVQVVEERVERLREHIEKAPKSRKWKLRARIGERVKWYEDPDDPG